MNKYIIIERGSRGYVGGVEVKESKLGIEDFCNELLKLIKDLYEEEGGEESLEEFEGVSEEEDFWEVGLSEEEWFEVYKVCK